MALKDHHETSLTHLVKPCWGMDIKGNNENVTILIVYEDDIVVTGNDEVKIKNF